MLAAEILVMGAATCTLVAEELLVGAVIDILEAVVVLCLLEAAETISTLEAATIIGMLGSAAIGWLRIGLGIGYGRALKPKITLQRTKG